MRFEDIEIHVGEPSFAYTPIRELEAKSEAASVFSDAPTVEAINARFRSLAAQVGANAIIRVQYDSGISLTSWRSLKGTGLAVRKESDDVPCPVCAETIKRAAVRCRFCGADLQEQSVGVASQREAAEHQAPATPAAPSRSSERPAAQFTPNQEPLKTTDNPIIWILIVGGVFLFLTLISL